MSYPINYPTPQSANVQIFYVGTSDWIKPQGCSFVFALLISAGGNGAGGTTSAGGGGGGSGVVMTALIPAFLMPDQVRVLVPAGGAGSAAVGARLVYQAKDGTGYTLFGQSNGSNASGSTGGSGGIASGPGTFGAACIVQSIINGQSGSNAGVNLTPPSNTFLTGGAGGAATTTSAGGTSTTNYGYPTLAGGVSPSGNGRDGVSILSNLIVSQGGSGGGGGGSGSGSGAGGNGGNAGFGSGGGGAGICTSGTATGGKGGDGLIVLISW